jgi:LAO/AO transport system kinase
MPVIGQAGWRRALGRELTCQAHADVREILAGQPGARGAAWRIGFAGPPGAGKSTVLAALVRRRLQRGRSVGVLAVDPTSPINGGSLLGDRIRMDGVADEERVYIRSMPSGACHDGLCRNAVGLLDTLERAGFDEIMLETVGIGQIGYQAHLLVDTFVLTLVPASGDVIQAMKAGIMELADIYVVNKAEQPGAEKMATELRSLVQWRAAIDGRHPPVVLTSNRDDRGFAELDAALEAHREMGRAAPGAAALRRAYQLRALLDQRLDELLTRGAGSLDDLSAAFQAVAHDMPIESGPVPGTAGNGDAIC